AFGVIVFIVWGEEFVTAGRVVPMDDDCDDLGVVTSLESPVLAVHNRMVLRGDHLRLREPGTGEPGDLLDHVIGELIRAQRVELVIGAGAGSLTPPRDQVLSRRLAVLLDTIPVGLVALPWRFRGPGSLGRRVLLLAGSTGGQRERKHQQRRCGRGETDGRTDRHQDPLTRW